MKHLIIKFLNLEPSVIHDIEVISSEEEVFALISLRSMEHNCPYCRKPTYRIHDYRTRTIGHAILNGLNTTIVYNQRRYFCLDCSRAFPEKNPFVSSGKRISKYTVLRVMKELRNPRVTFSMAAGNASVSDTTAIRIFDQHAGIHTHPFPRILCIDEVYAVKYRQKVYACVLVDFITNQIYDLLPGRKKHQLIDYFSKIDHSVRSEVRYVSMDMWDTYRDVASLFFKNAKICVDSFHVVNLINRAFTQVRIRIMKSYKTDSEEYYLLKKFAWLLSKDYVNIPKNHMITIKKHISFLYRKSIHATSLVNSIISINGELEAAYTLKDEFLTINRTSTPANIEDRLNEYIDELLLFQIPEFTSVAKTLKKLRQEIINSFDTFDNRRISNGPVESVNSRIKLIKTSGNGYSNFERFRKRVLYSLNSDSSIKF